MVAGWILFAGANAVAMFMLPGSETIPYHVIWVSFVLLYGLASWSRATTWGAFSAITFVTAFPLLMHAHDGVIGASECSEIVLMAVIAALLVWHVNRHQAAQRRIAELRESERERSHNREIATRFGSHELRTRLTIVRGFAEYIHDKTTDEETRSDAGLILAEMDKATALAANLMTFVRVAALPTLELVDLDGLINSAVRRWSASVDRVWISTASAGQVLGDVERLEAALDCLIENATKFTTPTDSISIRARRDGANFVVVSVEDSGAGIPPQDVHRVTELFQTSSTAGNRAGSGLGLPIVRAIVEARGGSLQVASLVGAGTRITIRMPRGDIGSARALPPLPDAASQHTGSEVSSALRRPSAAAAAAEM